MEFLLSLPLLGNVSAPGAGTLVATDALRKESLGALSVDMFAGMCSESNMLLTFLAPASEQTEVLPQSPETHGTCPRPQEAPQEVGTMPSKTSSG
eukprot:CAMPEP_0195644996 /NCGR_PEP_ID=MMETSP0815-20121206/28700_1 /TAXON_ID=97485 /ORGANISM="Prymnesium parvum, Strain Texoma1" /LENGTH=94 /DNA_ID=CAMNT_0040788209 /DNA_START=169 /DNA_END=450 /DNA_ORIENTATION=+